MVAIVFSCDKPADVTSDKEELESITEAKKLYAEGDSLYYNFQYEESIDLYKKARLKSLRTSDFSLSSNLTNDIGLSYKKMGAYDSALRYYNLAAEIDLERGDTIALLGRWRNIGIVHKNTGNYSEAIRVLTKGLEIAKTAKHESRLAGLLNPIGSIYLQQERYRKASSYYKEALVLFRKLNQVRNESYTLNNLGTCYEGLRQYDSALNYYRKSIVLKQKTDTASLASTFYNIASVYGELYMYDSSYYYLTKSYKLRAKVGDRRGKARSANALADHYLRIDKPFRAAKFLDEALEYATEHSNMPMLEENYHHWAVYYQKTGKLDLAFSYLDKWAKMRDEVFNTEKIRTLELQSSFDLKQSENEREIAQQAALLANVSAKQNLTISIVLLLFLFLVSGFSFIFYKQRRRLIGLNQELNSKNKKISMLNQQNFHFTKNSLAGIVSMLNSQTSRLEEGQVKSTLTTEKLRMETINLLYRQLFVNENSDKVEISDYLTETVNNTIDSILGLDAGVEKKLDISKLELSNDVAFNLGMIVNEVCLNACKHAKMQHPLKFTLSLEKEKNGLNIFIADNGPGFPQNFDWQVSNSFGIQLIRSLVSDLEAHLQVDSSNGLSYQLKIPL